MKMNRKLVLILSLVLSLALATGGTLAYLSDTDADVNTMTLGNVHIEQHEYQREMGSDGKLVTDTFDGQESYVLEEFQQGKPLYPSAIPTNSENWDWDTIPVRMSQVDSYGGMQTFVAGTNAQDKFVTVENTGKSDAYVRTLVAIEIGNTDKNLIGVAFHQTWESREVGVIEIEGNKYALIEYTYKGAKLGDGTWRHQNGVLPAGDTTYPNLAQVYLSSEATNEDVEAIDGNGNGMLDILVVSQAIQTAGFEDAKTALDTGFGVISTTSHPWLDANGVTDENGDQEPDGEHVIPTSVKTQEELAAALAKGGKIILGADVTVEEPLVIPEGVTVSLDLAGKTITGTHGKSVGAVLKNNGDLTLTGGTVTSAGDNGGSAIQNNGTLVVNGTTLNGAPNANGNWPSYAINNTGVMTLNGCDITSVHGGLCSYAADAVATLNDCTLDMSGISGFTSHGFYTYNGGKIVVNGGAYANKAADQNATGASLINGFVEITDGTFSGRIEAYYGTPVIKGGTYSEAPKAAYVAEGCTVVDNGNGTWTVK